MTAVSPEPERGFIPPLSIAAIVPCNSLTASLAFYARLGFKSDPPSAPSSPTVTKEPSAATSDFKDQISTKEAMVPSTDEAPTTATEDDAEGYHILYDSSRRSLHLTNAVPGWVIKGQNPFGLYLYTEDVDGVAVEFARTEEIIALGGKKGKGGVGNGGPELKEWGMYEFAVEDPDGLLIRVGWPGRLRK